MTDIYQHRNITLAVGVFFPMMTLGVTLLSLPIWILPWTQEFAVARSTATTVYMATLITMTCTMPVVGHLLKALQSRVVVMIGIGLIGSNILLLTQATQFWQVILLFALLAGPGIALAGILPAQNLLVRLFPEKPGAILGLTILPTAVGGAVIPPLLAQMLETFGWRYTISIATFTSLLTVMPLVWFLLKDPKEQEQPPAERQNPDTPSDRLVDIEPDNQVTHTTRDILSNTVFWRIVIATLPLYLVPGSIIANIIPIAVDGGISKLSASYLLSISALSSAIGSILIGKLTDRIEPRVIYFCMATAMITALLTVAAQPDFILLAIAVSFTGLATGGISPWRGVVIFHHFSPLEFGKVNGLLYPFLLPTFTGSYLTALTRDLTGTYSIALLFIATLVLPGLYAVWPIKILETQNKLVTAEN